MILTHRDTAGRLGDYEHRPGGITLITLQNGAEFAKDNFQLYYAQSSHHFNTPRHRHNFEQVRIMMKGQFSWNPDRIQEEGMIGYFCEGTFYTQQGIGDSETLLLQVAGATGNSYMSPRQLRVGIDALKLKGEFRDGIYYPGEGSNQEPKDSYEAVWEHIFGRELVYPPARYEAPVMMFPENFAYVPMADAPGLSVKRLGTFNERGLALEMLKLEAGAAATLEAGATPYLLYAVSGAGKIEGQDWTEGASMQLKAGEAAQIRADAQAEFYAFRLPRFDS